MYIKPWSTNPQHLHFRKSLQLEELSHCGMKESGPQWNSLQDCLLGDGEVNTVYINRLRRWFQCRWKGKRRQWRNPRGWDLKYWICKCLILLRAGNGNQKLRFYKLNTKMINTIKENYIWDIFNSTIYI